MTFKISILGTRGIPARYGGFETFAEEISTILTSRGFDVTVYGRRKFFTQSKTENINGVHSIKTPTIFHKYLETPINAITAVFHALFQKYDAVLVCNGANSPFIWLLRLVGCPVAINVDGIERQRKKWNSIGKLWYLFGEWCSVYFSSEVVADANMIGEYYNKTYDIKPTVIAYGAKARSLPPGPTLAEFNLSPQNYILYVSRLEPENNALGVIQGYKLSAVDLPLVIVGDAPFADEYKAKLRSEAAGLNIIFTGFQFGDSYHELQSNALLYIQATEVGGTHPALIEAMAHGNCIIANGTPENIEVLNDCGTFYVKNNFQELAEILRNLVSEPTQIVKFGIAAKMRANKIYNWERVADQYEELFKRLVLKK